jgi:branched-chain amino acid transport system substrate-binding protein
MTIFNATRRTLLGGAISIAARARFAYAQTTGAPVQVGLLAPISGIYAEFGILMREGAEQAVKDINAAGGVKSLDGAKIDLRIFDCGDTTEKAKNAAQRMVADNPGLVAASGAYLSSFTLAASEVTERAELPMLTLSYSDLITGRGFRYIFQTSAKADAMANESLPVIVKLAHEATGKALQTVGIISDNTASCVSFVKPIRADAPTRFGLKIVMDETFTPPLSDATQLVQKVRSTRPDLLIMAISVISDAKLLIGKMNEFGLGRGRVPTVGSGIPMAQKELLETLSPAELEGFITIVGNWDSKGQEAIAATFKKTTGEPWMGQNGIATYGDMWLIAAALEQAAKPDRHAVADALRSMDLKTGAALYYPGHEVKFDKTGLREAAGPVVVQWQDSVPRTVYPPDSATGQLFWLKR